MDVNLRKIAIIGCGAVGAATAFSLMESGLYSEIVMVDVNKDKAEGEAMDILHGTSLITPMRIYAGSYEDIADAAVVVITAGAAQKPGETRLDLIHKNIAIFNLILKEIRFWIMNGFGHGAASYLDRLQAECGFTVGTRVCHRRTWRQ